MESKSRSMHEYVRERGKERERGDRVPNLCAVFCCFFQDISQNLDHNHSSRDNNWAPYGMLALQQVAPSAVQNPDSWESALC